MDNKKGILIVISGFSGAGKGTVVKKMLENYNYSLSISATTRKPRINEQNGRDYFFIIKEEFEKMIKQNKFFEWAEYCDNYYGTPKDFVKKQLSEGKDIILEIEVQGALKVKEQYPEAVLIFLTPPSIEELNRRLISRGTEHNDIVYRRIERASKEVDIMVKYDYVVINEDVDKCTEEINNIVISEHKKVKRNKNLMIVLKKEFEKILNKGEI